MSSTRRAASDISWLTAAQIAARIAGFAALPWLTRWLSPEAYGEAALVATVVGLLSVVALLGSDASYARAYFDSGLATPHSVEIVVWRVVLLSSVVAGTVGALVWALGLGSWLDASPGWWWAAGAGIVVSAMAAMAQMRARLRGEYARLALAIFAGGAGAALTSLLAARYWRQDSLPLILAMLVSFTLPVLVLGMPSIRDLVRSPDVSAGTARTIMGAGIATVVTAPLYWLISSVDRWFLSFYHSVEAVGVYSVGVTIGVVGLTFNTAVMSVALPELARRTEASDAASGVRGRLASRFGVAMMVAWVAVSTAGGDVVRLLAPPRFHDAAVVVPWIAAGVLFYGWSLIGGTMLLLERRMGWAAGAWAVAAAGCLALNVLLVPRSGATGAAIAQACSFALVAVLVWLAAGVHAPAGIPWLRITLALALCSAATLTMARGWSDSPLVSLGLKLPAGLLVAGLVAMLTEPGMLRKLRRKAG